MFLVIIAGVFELETFGQIEIELDRSQLPDAADRVLDLDVDLGTVERCLAFDAFIRDISFFERAGKL